MTLQVVVGGQFGSEAKGAVTAAVCADERAAGRDVTVVRVGGPNAGHSAYDEAGRLWALRQVPAGMVVDAEVEGVIADGSEVDLPVLLDEVDRLEAAGHKIRHRLKVSGEATVIYESHRAAEAGVGLTAQVGSTGKGIGAARADRIWRQADRVADLPPALLEQLGLEVVDAGVVGPLLTSRSQRFEHAVVIEGTQGYGLGLHAGFYPQCTSGDVRAIDTMAAAGVNGWATRYLTVHVVVRPYPIRVAGNSGPLLGETTWEELGLPVELTTVTKKPRRVGTWDPQLVRDALAANGPGARLAVSMVDQLPGHTELADDDGARVLTDKGHEFLNGIENETGALVGWYGVGPRVTDWRQYR